MTDGQGPAETLLRAPGPRHHHHPAPASAGAPPRAGRRGDGARPRSTRPEDSWPIAGRAASGHRRGAVGSWSGRCGSSTPVRPTWRPSSPGPMVVREAEALDGRAADRARTRRQRRGGRGARAPGGGRGARRRGVQHRSELERGRGAPDGRRRGAPSGPRPSSTPSWRSGGRSATGRPSRCPPICSPATTRLRQQHGGVAVARLVGGRCDGCHLALAPPRSTASAPHHPTRLVECEECGRLLAR